MHDDKPGSAVLVLLEAGLVLLAAFLASTSLGFVGVFATAMVVEDGGVAAMVASSRKLSIPLTATDPKRPPSLSETEDLVRGAIPGADVIVLPGTKDSWNLTAWFAEDGPEGVLGEVAAGLMHLGWERSDSTLVLQPSLLAAIENPRRMKFYIPSLMTMQALCFVVSAWLMLAWRKPALLPGKCTPASALGWGIGGALAAFAASSVIGGLFHLVGLEIKEQGWIQALIADRGTLLLLSPWLVLVGPISEEVFFRGYVFRRVYSAIGPATAYGASALLFGLIHVHPVGIPMYVAIGLVFCWVQRRTGTLWAPVVAHIVYNGVVLAIPFLVPR